MDFHAHEKTPRMLAPRADGACPFCITQLHEDALVCCGCGAHKWYYGDIYRPTIADLRFKFFFALFVFGITYYAPWMFGRIEIFVKEWKGIDLVWWPMAVFIGFLWVALIAHVNEFIRAARNPVDGVVWRRKRWG